MLGFKRGEIADGFASRRADECGLGFVKGNGVAFECGKKIG